MSATPSPTAASGLSQPSQYRPVGIVLAVGSGLLIGASFVLKKKGLLRSQAGHVAGEGVAYLKSYMWWAGMIMMICGEICNFGAYAFVEAILVTPLGALSVVICAILSHFILKEKLTLFGWIGCSQCILGSIIIALNGPHEQSVSTIQEFKKLFLAPGFLAFGSVCIVTALVIIFFIAPKHGTTHMICYIAVCSLIGGLSVSCTQALGACIVTSIRGNNQFKNWFTYFVLVFVAITLLTEIYYLNVALALFNTAMVTPTYYVLFTFCTLVTSVILYQGLKASAAQILTIVFAFFVICTGISILQMSKIDPRRLTHLDRKTTILLQATREEIKPDGTGDSESADEEKTIEATEEPGMDALAGRFSGLGGTVVRARRRATIAGTFKSRRRARERSEMTQTGASLYCTRSAHSESMDSTKAMELHREWLEEKRRGVGTSGAGDLAEKREHEPFEEGNLTHVAPTREAVDDGGRPPVPPLPLCASTSRERIGGPSRILSTEGLALSPTSSRDGELKRTPSVRFQDQARRPTTSPSSSGLAPSAGSRQTRSSSISEATWPLRPGLPVVSGRTSISSLHSPPHLGTPTRGQPRTPPNHVQQSTPGGTNEGEKSEPADADMHGAGAKDTS